jgi:hypothetical protein
MLNTKELIMTLKDDNRFYIDKEVFQKFQQQNPTGYFHLLYLVTETSNIALNKSIRDYQSKITDLEEKNIQEIDTLNKKHRENIKIWKTRYIELDEQNKKGDSNVKNENK